MGWRDSPGRIKAGRTLGQTLLCRQSWQAAIPAGRDLQDGGLATLRWTNTSLPSLQKRGEGMARNLVQILPIMVGIRVDQEALRRTENGAYRIGIAGKVE